MSALLLRHLEPGPWVGETPSPRPHWPAPGSPSGPPVGSPLGSCHLKTSPPGTHNPILTPPPTSLIQPSEGDSKKCCVRQAGGGMQEGWRAACRQGRVALWRLGGPSGGARWRGQGRSLGTPGRPGGMASSSAGPKPTRISTSGYWGAWERKGGVGKKATLSGQAADSYHEQEARIPQEWGGGGDGCPALHRQCPQAPKV